MAASAEVGTMNRWVLAGALALGTVSGNAFAFSSGPPDDFCGNPPDMNYCTLCHNSFPLNSGDGSLTLNGLPAAFEPGVSYDLSVVLGDPGQRRWGFELTVVNDLAERGGTLEVTDFTNTQLSSGALRDFVKHTFPGTYADTPGPTTWDFRWTAPTDDAQVTFYLAGNASNNSASPSGDYIYAISVTVDRETSTPVEATSWGRIKSFYR
jgi:hypothetical protein